MALIHIITNNGDGEYVICENTDPLYTNGNVKVVTKKPSNNHIWNNSTEEWELDETLYYACLRDKRDVELTRTDKFMLSDFPIDESDLATAITYRQALRDCPNQATIEECVMPECPLVLQD